MLGNDAVDAVLAHADQVQADVRAWEKVARNLDFV